jgi:DNA (cytosine-5)-methyltransferase 1
MKKMKLLDLFCGAGGLSLGFERANFDIVKAIDFDRYAVQTYNHNRGRIIAEEKNIVDIDDKFIKDLGLIDGMIGGPPCQGFSTAGQRIIDDDRNKLYREYFRILKQVRPKFFVIENVTGILNFGKGIVKNDIIKRADALGYKIFYKTLDTSKFGIPQIRLRVLFVGIKKELCKMDFIFPEGNSKPISIIDAIGDLPFLENGEDTTKYRFAPKTEYQKKMRDGSQILTNHNLSIHTSKTKRIIAKIPEGGSIMSLPESEREGRNYHALLRKMDRSKPSLCIDTGHRTYFHYEETRIPSTREVARLQSFPDSFEFIGPRNDQQRLVGNAVPPILAEIIAESIKRFLTKG